MIHNLKYLPRKTIIQLFSEVFDQVPAIIADIAPDGWESSAYYPLFHYSAEEEALLALLDKVTTTQYQQRFGVLKYRDNTFDDFDSLLKKFEFNYRPKPYHPGRELCSLFVDALSSMSNNGSFLLKDASFFYEVNPPVAHKAAEIVARDKGILTEKPYSLPMTAFHKRSLILEVNLIPLMRYLFKALPNTDFHWEYMDHEIFDFSDYSDDQPAKNDFERQNAEREAYYASEEFDDYIKQAEKELPAEAVVAYADVFGDWPKGYPPTKDYYLEWHKKVNDGR